MNPGRVSAPACHLFPVSLLQVKCCNYHIFKTLHKVYLYSHVQKNDLHDKQTIIGPTPVHLRDHSTLYLSLVTCILVIWSSMYWTVQVSWFFCHVCINLAHLSQTHWQLSYGNRILLGLWDKSWIWSNKYRHIKIQQAYLLYVLLLFPGKRCWI